MSEEEKQQTEEKEETPLDKYIRAGKIAKEALELAKTLVKPDAKVVDIAEKIEQFILDKGGKWAFPTNVSINNHAAHYSPPLDDKTVIKDGDVVKVDVGVHIDGYIADTAITINLNPEFDSLVKASIEATKTAIDLMKPGAKLGKIGAAIEDTIKSFGYLPVKNLSGHQLGEYELHSEKSIPLIGIERDDTVEEGEAYAVETFATNGSGSVHDLPQTYIFMLLPIRVPVRFKGTKQFLGFARKEYKSLPFAERWVAKRMKKASMHLAIRELQQSGALHSYPVLADKKNSIVTQSEHTIIIESGGARPTTM